MRKHCDWKLVGFENKHWFLKMWTQSCSFYPCLCLSYIQFIGWAKGLDMSRCTLDKHHQIRWTKTRKGIFVIVKKDVEFTIQAQNFNTKKLKIFCLFYGLLKDFEWLVHIHMFIKSTKESIEFLKNYINIVRPALSSRPQQNAGPRTTFPGTHTKQI